MSFLVVSGGRVLTTLHKRTALAGRNISTHQQKLSGSAATGFPIKSLHIILRKEANTAVATQYLFSRVT